MPSRSVRCCLRDLDVGDDDADVVQPAEERHGGSLRTPRAVASGAWTERPCVRGSSGTRRHGATRGTEVLEQLFADDATYSPAPFDEVVTGRAAIAAFWDFEREGPDEVFRLSAEPVAVEGDTGVVRLEVTYGDPPTSHYRDLWIVTLGPDGRCTTFEEWPFFPGQGRVAP